MDVLSSASLEDIMTIGGFGEIMAESVVNYFSLSQTREMLEELKVLGLNMKSTNESKDNRFEGKTFVVTGTLVKYKRNEIEELIESFGGKAASSVSKKTSYVLAGEAAGSKLTKANELGIPVISEDEFEDMIK